MRYLLSILIILSHVQGESCPVAEYIDQCRKANGAFGPMDQTYTDAAWNYPAVKTLELLGENLDHPENILKHGLGSPKGHVGPGHWLFFHQHGIRESLGVVCTPQQPEVTVHFQGEKINYYGSPYGTDGDTFFKAGGSGLDARDAGSQTMGFYNLSSLYYLLEGLQASGRTASNPCRLAAYITARQATNGGFVDLRVQNHPLQGTEAHVAHTFQAMASLQILKQPIPRPDACINFLQSCQGPSGGFRWNPSGPSPGNDEDVYYTWAAVSALKLLGSQPLHTNACIQWIQSLRNPDGGFGDKPGWRSRLYSTYYAVETLANLAQDGDPKKLIPHQTFSKKTKAQPLPEGLQIYQALIKVPMIKKMDLLGLQKRGFDLIGIKSYDFEKAAELQRFAHSMNPPMEVVLCPEAYPHRTRWIGGPLLHHIANVPLNPSWSPKQIQRWHTIDQAGQQQLPWPEYQKQVIQPIRQLHSFVYPEQEFEMEFALSAYDDGLDRPYGYNAILTGFNWSPRDFVRVFPWKERYTDKLIPIADADAHGDLKKWSPQLDHTRMLFLAKSPTWGNFQKAAQNRRVVCVIYNEKDALSPVTFYGPSTVVNHVQSRILSWKWW